MKTQSFTHILSLSLTLVLTLLALYFGALTTASCGPKPPGDVIPNEEAPPGTEVDRLTYGAEMYRSVDFMVSQQWNQRSTLPAVNASNCPLINDYVIRVATEEDWMEKLGMCPYVEGGCSQTPPCDTVSTCATGTMRVAGGGIQRNKRLHIILSPGENADGHVITARHEMAHYLMSCAAGDIDYGHTNREVWQGVIWDVNSETSTPATVKPELPESMMSL